MKFSKTCLNCLGIANAKMAEKRATKHQDMDKENTESGLDKPQKENSATKHPPTLTWDKFLSLLAENKDHPFELEAFVKMDQDLLTAVKSTHDQAIGIANAVKEATGFRFKCVEYLQEINKYFKELMESIVSMESGHTQQKHTGFTVHRWQGARQRINGQRKSPRGEPE
jgi:hypothetical protein